MWTYYPIPPEPEEITSFLYRNDPVPVFFKSRRDALFIGSSGPLQGQFHFNVARVEVTYNAFHSPPSYSVEVRAPFEDTNIKRLIIEQSQPCNRLKSEKAALEFLNHIDDDIAKATSICKRLSSTFDVCLEIINKAKRLAPLCKTREGYEQACDELEITQKLDVTILLRHDLYFQAPTFPCFSVWAVAEIILEAARFDALKLTGTKTFEDVFQGKTLTKKRPPKS